MSVDFAEPALETEIADLIFSRFIARSDVYSRQLLTGEYNPVNAPLNAIKVLEHLRAEATYGHYLLDGDQTNLFAFDIDFRDGAGNWVQEADLTQMPMEYVSDPEASQWFAQNSLIYPEPDLRAAWKNRAHPGRAWFKRQMRQMVEELTCRIRDDLGLATAAAYSGNKGVHVYGFTGRIPAGEAREAASLVLQSWGKFQLKSGSNFYEDKSPGWYSNFGNFEIEVFPKQDSVKPGSYGNLMRLPLGRNHKNVSDPTFFLDQSTAHDSIYPATLAQSKVILQTGNPWSFR